MRKYKNIYELNEKYEQYCQVKKIMNFEDYFVKNGGPCPDPDWKDFFSCSESTRANPKYPDPL
jgi:hypothetical protein